MNRMGFFGGRYYLPYRLHATRVQFEKAYGGLQMHVRGCQRYSTGSVSELSSDQSAY
jgi:hypothetical protein